jgi:hypothetical protein
MASFLFRLLVWSTEAAIGWMIASAAAYWLLSSVWFPAATIAPLVALVGQGDFGTALVWLGTDRVLILSALAGAAIVIQILVAACLLFVREIQSLDREIGLNLFNSGA